MIFVTLNKNNGKAKKRSKQLRSKKKGLPANGRDKYIAEVYVSSGFSGDVIFSKSFFFFKLYSMFL